MYSYNEGEDNTMTTGEIIKKLRDEHDLTQEQLGEIVGVQKSAIAKYERGKVVNLKRATIEKLANYFGVLPSYIMGLSEEKIRIDDSEADLIIAFRKADPDIQNAIKLMLKVKS
jgi:transcriptional regulator with XRE-family HTH domain